MKIFSIRQLLLALILLTACVLGAAAPADRSGREIVQLNREWTFKLGDPIGAEAPDYAEQDWQRANLPHSFSIPYFLGSGFYVGYGWYRKSITLPPGWQGKQISLEFDGVFQ